MSKSAMTFRYSSPLSSRRLRAPAAATRRFQPRRLCNKSSEEAWHEDKKFKFSKKATSRDGKHHCSRRAFRGGPVWIHRAFDRCSARSSATTRYAERDRRCGDGGGLLPDQYHHAS